VRIPKWYVCLFLLPVCALAQGNTPAGDSLPVKRVVLYKSGVGYFEHLGRVHESQDVTIPFTSGQLNDVLKSLTVLDLNGGRITGVEYGSAAPMDRQLGDLRLPVGEKASLTELLGALRAALAQVPQPLPLIAGVPLAMAGVWFWHKGNRNTAVIESAYTAYMASLTYASGAAKPVARPLNRAVPALTVARATLVR